MARRPFLCEWRDRIAYADELSTTERAIAWRCSMFADADGTRVYPGSVRLAIECGLRVQPGATQNSTVDATFKKLVGLGYAVKVRQGRRGQNAEYRLLIPSDSNRGDGSYLGDSNRESAQIATVSTGPTVTLTEEGGLS